MATRTRRSSSLSSFHFEDFSGGWNIRDAPSELADNESPDLINVTLDERGGVIKRLGCQPIPHTPLGDKISNLFYWKEKDYFFIQYGNVLAKTNDFVSFATVQTFSTVDAAALCVFQDELVIVHPVDRVFTYNGTLQANWPTSPKGNCSAVWQNKVWISGDPSAPSRVYASKAGDPHTYDLSNDYNDMRDKDHAPVTALGGGPGMDIAGRAGLLVFKKNWVGRINDPKAGETFGQYTTLHNEAGASGPQAVTQSSSGLVCFVNERGIWASDGDSIQLASTKISRLFRSDQLNFNLSSKWCAEQHEDRVIFSLSRQQSAFNDMILEFHPTQGWIVPHNCGFSSFTVYTKDERTVYGAVSGIGNVFVPFFGRIFKVFQGWADDGEDIPARFQTRWFEPQGGYQIRLRRLRVQARGNFMVHTKHDYIDTLDIGQRFESPDVGGRWGQDNWGAFNWGASAFESFDDLYSWGVAKAFSVVVREKSQTAAFTSSLLMETAAQETGSFGFYGVLLDYVRLGYS